MPLIGKGEPVHRSMVEDYGDKKGESVFHASRNAGKVTGAGRAGFIDGMRAALARGIAAKDAIAGSLKPVRAHTQGSRASFGRSIRDAVAGGTGYSQALEQALTMHGPSKDEAGGDYGSMTAIRAQGRKLEGLQGATAADAVARFVRKG